MSAIAGVRYPDSLPATWLAARLAVDPAKIDAMRRGGELIAVREPGSTEWLYPAWQFEAWKPRRGVARVVAAAREAQLDEARLYDLLTAPLGLRESGRRRLVDLLLEGREDEVVAAVRAS
ncbi:MAG TPA: hypothetical protein VI409_04620 [Gaiellaceae bacterium]|nr:hypothetical protein [Gaiellaceae bacterium]